eukprot:CAMPEP_0181470670 /NCGR_PEP_ID=MMETSP1110-20121109/38674_1 /TAXON_ID=174948 /ORGANISM="Symbiodinium sp., Strain CCMP421" /LENGTH=65 /DNA_ID=CAMNT_0023595655 /DNA_START=205 /DNA_END=402 /DNA_ORIENTATION=+
MCQLACCSGETENGHDLKGLDRGSDTVRRKADHVGDLTGSYLCSTCGEENCAEHNYRPQHSGAPP